MTETSELVKRLRADVAAFWSGLEKPADVRLLAEEAADAIERLERERDDLAHDVERHLSIATTEATRAEGAWLAGYAAAREQAAKVADDAAKAPRNGYAYECALACISEIRAKLRSMEPEEKK